MSSDLKWIALSCGVCIVVIWVYGMAVCSLDFEDPLVSSAFVESGDHPMKDVTDGWAITHFLFFAALTVAFPDRWALLFLLGVLWELTELYFGGLSISKCSTKKKQRHCPIVSEPYVWWYARWQDVLTNALGIATGLVIYITTTTFCRRTATTS